MQKRTQHLKRLYTKWPEHYWTVPYSNAARPVAANILLTKAAAKVSKRGIPFECVLANGILAHAALNPTAFPHKVLYAYVERSQLFIVDRFSNGQPSHAWRYMHSFTKLTKAFDKMNGEEFTKKYDGFGFVLNMRPGRKPRDGVSNIGGNGTGGTRSSTVSRGAMERAMAAGLIPANMNILA